MVEYGTSPTGGPARPAAGSTVGTAESLRRILGADVLVTRPIPRA